jgi:hypothetical protein
LRGLLVFVVVAILLVGGFLLGDRYARDRAERSVAAQLQRQLATPQPPDVAIAGFPFLTQAIVGTIGSIQVTADSAGSGRDAGLTVRHLDLQLSDVSSDDRFQTATASRVAGDAQLDLAALSTLTGQGMTYAGGGRVRVEAHTDVLGSQVLAVITGRPELNVGAQTVTLVEPAVRVGRVDLPDAAARLLIEALVKPIPVTGVPYGLQIRSLAIDGNGLSVDLAGENVPLSR